MRYLSFILVLFIACNANHQQKIASNVDNSWTYQLLSEKSIDMDGQSCTISLEALPYLHQLKYTISYKGSGFLEEIKLSTEDSRTSATLIKERIWIAADTIIQATIHPINNTYQFSKVDEKGPLRSNYIINYFEKGRNQHLRFQLKEKSYQNYLKNYPYVSSKKSYQLSHENESLKLALDQHLVQILKEKRGKSGIRFSENEMNVIGLIYHVNCLYDGQYLKVEVNYMNHTDYDLWLCNPSTTLTIDQEQHTVDWNKVNTPYSFGKGKRCMFSTSIKVNKIPKDIHIPVNNISFFDKQPFFPEGTQLNLIVNNSLEPLDLNKNGEI
ncbi:hypothetical protein [Flammeovirga pacifica]|uniref:Uncharacterized protein n=1 Tax=Flammeovirga pacifica TaxID=915059 RepID=A0A1S1Z246_FLAPC|nr:hypothetical protein [Flammeovirga pacifica]OHX67349.1 hypothetical protein NH26_13855 [Flammeovirga pacifica]